MDSCMSGMNGQMHISCFYATRVVLSRVITSISFVEGRLSYHGMPMNIYHVTSMVMKSQVAMGSQKNTLFIPLTTVNLPIPFVPGEISPVIIRRIHQLALKERP